jgi:tyrosine-protein kinase Etk/Wzc
LQTREDELTSRIKTQENELESIPARAVEGQRLTNQVATTQTIFNSLQAKYEAIKLADNETVPDVRLFERALAPTSPQTDQAPRLFFMAVIASIGAGLGLALLRDRLDRRFRYPEQAVMELGLTIVGTVPSLSFGRRGQLSVAAMSQVVESFRTLRLAVRYHFGPDQQVVLCVSSAGPGEGKSLVSSNLAVAFANAGQKTLLIDGDVRRGVVHTAFNAERRPGLVDYLGGSFNAMSIIQATTTTNLSVLASGSRSRKAPEFLVSDRMSALIGELRHEFEVIIIDSAPFAAGMDAYALGAAAGAMLVVLRQGQTDRKLAAAKLEVLDRLPISLIGSVVNGISSGASYRYYSYDGDYAPDEGIQDEADFPMSATGTAPARLPGKK